MKYDFKKRELDKNKYKENKEIKDNKNFLKFTIINYLLKRTKTFLYPFFSKDIKNIERKEYKINSEKDVSLKILFLSDLHLEIVDNTDSIKKALENDDYFDYIVFGGDYYDSDKDVLLNEYKWNNLIKFLKTKSNNIIGVLGNHDGINCCNLISGDLTLLIDKEKSYNNISFFGVEDFVTFSNLTDDFELDENKFNIIISHTPDFIRETKNNYDLMLSGHTHGGQIRIFGYSPIKNCKDKKTFCGFWKYNNINGITTSGVGCSGFPLRYGVRPEIVCIYVNK